MKSLKQQLYEGCLVYVEERLTSLTDSIKVIQQSANEETKSSAGDKYETGRAMAQLEIDKHRSQLAEALKMKQELLRIPVEDDTQFINPGSLVFTSRGNFYIAVNAGQHHVDDQIIFTVSVGSPIARKLIGLRVNDTFTLNHQEFTLLKIQ
jgi:hypothetical protein